jgi:delta 1-pyrroline-5-carboxylate dehydrogenase
MTPLVLADVPPDAELLDTDVPAPVLSMVTAADDDELVARAAACPYRLGASVFGSPDRAAALTRRLPVGVVVVNDMIVPTADPRLPFGGRGASGFGTTRGAEGLLEMTAPKAIIRRRGRFRPHFDPVQPGDEKMFDAFIRLLHAPTLAQRARALRDVMKAGRRRTRRDRPSREER